MRIMNSKVVVGFLGLLCEPNIVMVTIWSPFGHRGKTAEVEVVACLLPWECQRADKSHLKCP